MTYIQTRNNELRNNIDMLTGCWNRVHVSDDVQEIDNLVNAAEYYLDKIGAAKLEIIQWDEDMHKDHPRIISLPTVPTDAEESFQGCVTALKIAHDSTTLSIYGNLAVKYIQKAAEERKSTLANRAEHPEWKQYE